MARISGCLTKLLLWVVIAIAAAWGLIVALNPWALHIGARPTPLLYWHGTGTVRAKDGKTFPLYLWFSPGRPQGTSGINRREGKIVSARLQGGGWLCIAPGNIERMDVTGTMYGGYTTDSNSLLTFRLLEWWGPYVIKQPKRGFFDVAGTWHGSELVMDRPNEQGIPFLSGLLIDHAVVTLRWASYGDFESVCNALR